MIITDKFVLIHMHKTGGQSLGHILHDCVPSAKPIGYHYPYHMLPVEYADLPVVGMVRNPWDWYVSWYAFNTRPEINTPLFFIISDGFQADFKRTIKNLVNLCSDSPESQNYRNALIDILPETLEGNAGVGLTKDSIRNMSSPELGYYSWQFQRMHGDIENKALHIGRFENLQQEFLSIMRQLEVEEVAAMQAKFDTNPRMNASRHSHYSRYLDDELRELIAQKESQLIDKYGYKFERDEADEKRIEFPNIQISYRNDSFQKLSGKAHNFLLMKPDVDLEFIKRKLAKIPERAWHQSGREKTYEAHKQTQSLLLIHDDDFRHYNPTYHDLYSEFRRELKPIFDFIANYYDNNGYIVRALFARLQAHGRIGSHTDGMFSLLKCHRIHIPVITNDQVTFTIGGEEKVLGEGEMWEINNATLHAVDNRSDEDRIHLIVDWVPNSTVRPEDKRPTPPPRKVPPSSAIPSYNGRTVGRNEPCPCNSGKKFKQCHGAPH
ncbi:MAG: aspartyl/asparaginyl beta-hydroxylase domain-containing protein [Gammaproteobacteria bacterium]|nr:aspartyl/asparaginyl beta-hydroxylase domain-containing protein [Gammaproteobacteria bacterium]MDH3858750.1 aspartyl/asparaginyl beta-hydroxylase domain-containing protein [Gammaproteobacteria bacterium]